MKLPLTFIKGNPTPAQHAAIEAAIAKVLEGGQSAKRAWARPNLRHRLPLQWRGWRT